jgi:HSP20 family protein
MTQLLQKRKNGNGHAHGSLFPSLRNDFWTNRFFSPALFDFDDDFFNGSMSTPPANISETEKEFKLELSVPGFKKEDFRIDIDNGTLTISCEKEEEAKEDNTNFRRREFSYSRFSRSFELPDNTDEGNITAKYDNGMLQLTVPKKDISSTKPKKEIKVD